MPRGPKGEKRPADVIGNAVKVMRIAVGEESDDVEGIQTLTPKDIAKMGAVARSGKLSAQERSEIAKLAAKTRWAAKSK